MENRFGFKDLIVTLLLVAIIVLIVLGMVQYDRQWQQVQRIAALLEEQTTVLSDLKRQLAQGVTITGQTPVASNSNANTGNGASEGGAGGKDPFFRVRAAQQKPDFARGDWLVDAFGAKVAKITPLVVTDAYGNAIGDYVLESLAVRDADTLEWRGLLAKGWTIDDRRVPWQAYVDQRMAQPLTEEEVQAEADFPRDAGADKQKDYRAKRLAEGRRIEDISAEPDCPPAIVLRFELRPGITFSDGKPLTSADAVFTWSLIQNPNLDAPRLRIGLDKIKAVKADGPSVVIYEYKQPYFQALEEAASIPVLPAHFYSQYSPEQINQTPGLLMGSGPYRMESPTDWTPGRLLVMVRNRRYWGLEPGFDRIVFHEINNPVAQLTRFKNGELDFFPAQPEQFVEMKKDQALLERTRHWVYERPNGGYGFIAWNQRRGGKPTLFADARVRQAMTMLINRPRLNEDKLRGFGITVTGPFNRLSKQSDPDIQPWPYDVERARARLAEAGWRDTDNDGLLDHDPDGSGRRVPFRFRYTFPAETGLWDDVALMMKDDMAKVGIALEPDPLEWSVFDQRLKTREFDAISLAWGGGVEVDIQQMFSSAQKSSGGDNFTGYSNPELDQLIDRARTTLDEDQRMNLWRACHRIIHQDQPYSFLYTRQVIVFAADRIQNITRTRLGLNDRYEWYVPASMQKYRD